MGVMIDSAHKTNASPKRMDKAVMIDSEDVLPKAVPFIKSTETVQGDRGVGTIKQTNFADGAPFKNMKNNNIRHLDLENYLAKLTLAQGGALGNQLESIDYEDCNAAPAHGSDQKKNVDENKKWKARVFAMDTVEDFDLIAADECLTSLNLMGETSSSVLKVSLPAGGIIDIDRIVKSVRIYFDGTVLEADLHIILMKDFDIILGMDWLSSNRATIMCHEKEVVFQKNGDKVFKFYRSKVKALPRLIFALQAEKLLAKGNCQDYLVNLQGKPSEEITLESVPVVCNFKDVFPGNLPGTPPDRQVELAIDLVSGAALVSKAPYRMASKELQELKAGKTAREGF